MSMMPPDNWIPEEPPDSYFPETVLDEPPDWVYDTSFPEEPPDLFPPREVDFVPPPDEEAYVLARLDAYVPPPIPHGEDYTVPDWVYLDTAPDVTDTITVRDTTPASDTVERNTDWQLQEAGVIIEAIQPDPDADPTGYAVGVVEVWGDPHTGDQTGAYLHMADAPHLGRAEEMRDNIYRMADEAGVSDPEFGDFAHRLIKGRGEWQPLSESQWGLVDNPPVPDMPDFQDDTIWEARDRMLEQTFETLEREDIDQPIEVEQVIQRMGIQIEDFDPATTPPPLFDENSNTAYWIGVYQPDENNSDEAITSILSIQQDENGQTHAHLAPVATGDFDHAHQTAEYLLKVAERTQDVGQLLDAAEGMAVATQHRELWGMEVDEDITFNPVSMELD